VDESDGDSVGTVDYSDSEDEGLDGYRKGGYHPVQVGEEFKGGAYTVLKKLGWGHFSTVWLVACVSSGAKLAMKVGNHTGALLNCE
jgi:serine/threonine-protein kinase SRPK3